MTSTLKRRRSVPAISQVDRADNHLGSLLSDLDGMASDLEHFAGETDDQVFLAIHGIADDDQPRVVDPATIARLLVFANELDSDSEAIREYGQRLRASLLAIYREHIFEPSGRRRMRGEDDA